MRAGFIPSTRSTSPTPNSSNLFGQKCRKKAIISKENAKWEKLNKLYLFPLKFSSKLY